MPDHALAIFSQSEQSISGRYAVAADGEASVG
jgi:hypothetical protein